MNRHYVQTAFGHGGHGAVWTIAAGSCRLDTGSSQVSAAWAEGTVLQRGASQTPSAPCPSPTAVCPVPSPQRPGSVCPVPFPLHPGSGQPRFNSQRKRCFAPDFSAAL